MIDENAPEVAAANIINDLLRRHKAKWDGDDEIQDMCIEAFLLGVKYWQEADLLTAQSPQEDK